MPARLALTLALEEQGLTSQLSATRAEGLAGPSTHRLSSAGKPILSGASLLRFRLV